MTPTPYDFRSPPPAETERRVAAWAADACRRLRAAWAGAVPFSVTFEPGPASSVAPPAAARLAPADGFAVVGRTPAPEARLFLGLPGELVRGLIAGLLGETPAGPPPTEAPLAPLEKPLFEYLARDLFVAPWAAAWPDAPGPTLAVADAGPVRTVWRLPADMAVAVRVTATTPFGTYDCPVLLPRGEWAGWLTPPKPAAAPAPGPGGRGPIEALVKGMRVDVTVDLGTADVTLLELSKLRVGDLIVLSQKVTDPLPARVGGEPKWSVWPGLVGTRHAVQVRAVGSPCDPAKG